ncbi:collagen alpha-1(I) chain-like isoform X4 [Manacus candei]|uniref:collagen alpha-1(I) chain-like isoform X4 n=1 Tax=Manacus candei TaxID=415023 RepID=UPI002225B86A|nr:collagen alpha-1(I) chain-like isoform X4 [Manacus candei]
MLLTKSIKLVMLISVQGSLGGEAAPGAGGPAVREFPYGPAAAPPGAGGTCGPGRGYRWRCGLRSRRRCRGCPAAVPKVPSGGAEGAQRRCRRYPAAVPRVPSGGAEGTQWRCRGCPVAVPKVPSGGAEGAQRRAQRSRPAGPQRVPPCPGETEAGGTSWNSCHLRDSLARAVCSGCL